MTRQYIGARYVPKFADPIAWDKTNSYEALTIVTYLNNSYTSKKPVPANTEITDTEYWVVTGNYNAQVEEYRQEVEKIKELYTTPEMYYDASQGDDWTTAINNMFASENKRFLFKANKTYKINNAINIPSNCVVDFNNCKIQKNSTNARINIVDVNNTIILNLYAEQILSSARGSLVWINNSENIIINNISLINTVAKDDITLDGIWAFFVSGKHIKINNLYVNNYSVGWHADGIHLGYCEDVVIDGLDISSGDDCIALNYSSWGENIPSNNIIIKNGNCKSYHANIIRIDCDSDAPANGCYKNVLISDIVCYLGNDNNGLLASFSDKRLFSNTTVKHENIVLKNIYTKGYFNGALPLLWSEIPSDSANYESHYDKISLINVIAERYTNISNYGSCVLFADEIYMNNVNLKCCMNNEIESAMEQTYYFHAIKSIVIKNSLFSTKSNNTFVCSFIINNTDGRIVVDNTIIEQRNTDKNRFGVRLDAKNTIIDVNNSKFINIINALRWDGEDIPKVFSFKGNSCENMMQEYDIEIVKKSTNYYADSITTPRCWVGRLNCKTNNILIPPTDITITTTHQFYFVGRNITTGDMLMGWYDRNNKVFNITTGTISSGEDADGSFIYY